jgi:hypothetical protein
MEEGMIILSAHARIYCLIHKIAIIRGLHFPAIGVKDFGGAIG